MKHERIFTGIAAAMLAFCISLGAANCLITAFDLDMTGSLVTVCGGLAVFSALLLSLKRGGILLLGFWALALGCLHREGEALRQFWQLIHQFTAVYDRAYGCGVLILPETMEAVTGFDRPFWIWCALVCGTVCRSVCHRKPVWLAFFAALLPLGTCIVVTDTVPEELWLLLLLTGLLLLLLPSAVRQENGLQSLKLTAVAALPAVLALTVLFQLNPKENYVNRSEQFREKILMSIQTIPRRVDDWLHQLLFAGDQAPPLRIDLSSLGPRVPLTYPILEVTAERDGPLYLRQQDFDRYDGLGWSAARGRQESFGPAGGPPETLRVLPLNRIDTRFLPYYPAEARNLLDGGLEHPAPEREYSLLRTHLPENWRQTAYGAEPSSDRWQEYVALPENTRQQAEALLEGLYPASAAHTEKADIIAALVTNSAVYDLRPGAMPATEPDFALWFLREGERGYCVHFATAATVLLRAAGIPARYVTGYMAEGAAGIPVTVTEENAHAWAEYYEPGLDLWIPLEATPARETVPSEPRPEPTVTEAAQIPVTLPTEPETGTESTLPPASSEAARPQAEPEESGPLPVWPLLLLLLVPVPALQRRVRLMLHRRRQQRGSANEQALARWQEALRLSRLLKESPGEELMELAQKAKFSQHELTPEELHRFDSFNRSCLAALRKKPWYLRLIHQYIYAAY